MTDATTPKRTPRVRIVHERFTELGGAERVVEQLLRAFPDASVFAPLSQRSCLPEGMEDVPIEVSSLQRWYRGRGRYAHLLPLLPLAMARADLSEVDVVLTSHHAFAQRVRPPHDVPVVSYVHTPARWLWDANTRAGEPGGKLGGWALAAFAALQRRPDRRAAQRPARLIANSTAVADRINQWWGRESVVVPPPVRTHFFTPHDDGAAAPEREDFFLVAGRLVPYKRPEIAVAAARRAGVRLVVVGEGRQRAACEAVAGPGTQFLGRVDDRQLRDLMRRTRGLVFPGEEDFGIVPVEAMACAAPVVALGRGGAVDTVLEGTSGVLVRPHRSGHDALVAAFAVALADFDDGSFDPVKVRTQAEPLRRGHLPTTHPDDSRGGIVRH